MNTRAECTFRRILVPLDDPASSADALSAAAALAARVGAHLEGLFVEDVNLLRAAALPFAAVVVVPSGTLQRVDRARVEAQLRAVAEAARAALAGAATALQIAWSFRVERGELTVAIVEAATSADLVVVGRRAPRTGAGAEPFARAVALRAPGSVFVAGARLDLDRPLAVAYDGSAAADEALDVVRNLDGRAPSVIVLVSAATERRAQLLAERARARLVTDRIVIRWTGGDRLEHLIDAARDEAALLVVAKDAPILSGDGLDRLLDAVDAPLLIVR